MKIAIVHDWLIRLGGAERVLIALHRIFPDAPIYVLFHDKKFIEQYLPKAKIIPSFLQKIPNIKKLHPWFKILMPPAVESLNLSGFDLVISSSHEFSHGVLVRQKTGHISFYHSPSRILWDRSNEYIRDFKERGKSRLKIFLIKLGQHFLRLWDWPASRRPDIMIANSKHVAGRIKKYYGKEAKVILPPVEVSFLEQTEREMFGERVRKPFWLGSDPPVGGSDKTVSYTRRSPLERPRMSEPNFPAKDYFLIVSQLYPHKNIDLAIRAFKNLPKLNLLIAGDGPEYKRLKKLKSGNVKLLGFIPDEELAHYYKNCSAYLICNEEDFGISPVEAMSFGKPVLAYKKGGAEETILEGATGEFFYNLDHNELAKAVESISRKIKNGRYDSAAIKKYSEKFNFRRFKKEILDLIGALNYNQDYSSNIIHEA